MPGPSGGFPKRRLIVGMNSLDDFFHSGRTIPWIKTQNAIAFLRPIPDVGVGTPGPTARVAESLRLRQISLALTQLLLAREQVAVREYAGQRISQTSGGLLEQPQLGASPGPRSRGVHHEQVRPVTLGTDRDREQ